MHPAGPHHLIAIRPDGKPEARTFLTSEHRELLAWILDKQGIANIYFTVNRLHENVRSVKAKKSDVSDALFLHVDIDDPDDRGRLEQFELKPTVVVFSGGGYQAFSRLEIASSDLQLIERYNEALARALGGDKCHNIDRIMRVPGTLNVPNKKKRAAGRTVALARVVEAMTDWARAYPLSAFRLDNVANLGAGMSQISDESIRPTAIEDLPHDLGPFTRTLIEHGDDPERPIGSADAHYPSRSEVVFRVATDLVRAGCDPRVAAGILINPRLGISRSVIEKKRPEEYAVRQIRSAINVVSKKWPDETRSGAPRATFANTMLAIRRLGLACHYDEFHRRKAVAGHILQSFQGDLSDDACTMLRRLILEQFCFDPGKDHTRDAVDALCLENTVHPIRDYLDGLMWDGQPRLDNWLTVYLGAEDTPLNNAIGRLMLLAAVRRVRKPGVKFDNVVVLEGPQGSGKSTALKILAGEDNFSDQDIITLDAKAQMENVEGIWIYELSELEGLSRADTNKVKAFASRSEDRGRPAYGRFRENRPRQAIFVGTTNEDTYLRDMTGNRRFWPVRTGIIELQRLTVDRDQIWAEAAYREAQSGSLILPEEFWRAATEVQEDRLEQDPWVDLLGNETRVWGEVVGDKVRVSTASMLNRLEIPPERQQQFHAKRLAHVMRRLGWDGPKLLKFSDDTVARGYERQFDPERDAGLLKRPKF
jgi:hypothetical protein